MTILIIDSDRDIVDIVEYVLAEAGLNVVIPSSDNIISEIQELKPDLILMDDWSETVRLYNLCKVVKSNRLTKHIPVLLFSTTSDLHMVAESCLADGYIEKPFDINELEKAVKYFLKNKA